MFFVRKRDLQSSKHLGKLKHSIRCSNVSPPCEKEPYGVRLFVCFPPQAGGSVTANYKSPTPSVIHVIDLPLFPSRTKTTHHGHESEGRENTKVMELVSRWRGLVTLGMGLAWAM